MIKRVYRSKCCNAKVRADGIPDFLGSKEVCTISFTCLNCGKPCDVMEPEGQKQKMHSAEKPARTRLVEKERMLVLKKQIKKQIKRIDLQGAILQKLLEFFAGIKTHPRRGMLVTPKNKRRLAEIYRMERELFKD